MKKTILTTLMILLFSSVGFGMDAEQDYKRDINELITQKDPFIMAIIKGDFDTVVNMIEEGRDVNLRLDGKTPLMYAARYNRADIIRVLVGKGAYIKAKDRNGNTAMKFAELANAKEAMALLKELS